MNIKNAARSTIIIMVFSAASKMLGLIRESALAANFGASYQTDAYKIAFEIPTFLLSLVSATIGMTFIPVYASFVKNKTRKETDYFLNNILNIVILLAVFLTVAGILLAPFLVRLIAPGFKGDTYKLAIKLTMMMSSGLIFISISNLEGSYLQSNNRFVANSLVGIPYNICIIVSIIFFSSFGMEAVAIGTCIAFAGQFAIQIPSVIKSGYRYKPIIDFKEKGFKEMLLLAMPVLVSSAFNQLYMMIDRMLASGLSEGSVSALDYANKVNSLVYNIFIISIVTVCYPRFCQIADDIPKMRYTVAKGLKVVVFISLPMMVILLLLRIPIVSILFERGVFDSQDTKLTAIALGCFSIGVIGTGFREMLNTVFYSLKDTRTPIINGISVICINIILNLIFIRIWGVAGLAISASVSAIISGAMLLYKFKRRIVHIRGRDIVISFLQAILGAIAMGLCICLLKNNIFAFGGTETNLAVRLVSLSVCILLGSMVYICVLYILKVEEVRWVVKLGMEQIKSVLNNVTRKICFINRDSEEIKLPDTNLKTFGSMNVCAVFIAEVNNNVFWPLTRQNNVQQSFNVLIINESIKVLSELIDINKIYIIANKNNFEYVNSIITEELPKANILIEPFDINSTASITFAALTINSIHENAVMCLLQSNYYIVNKKSLWNDLNKAISIAGETEKMVAMGLKSLYPSAGYNYMKCRKITTNGLDGVYEMLEFIDVPQLDKVEEYVKSGCYLLNSGIYVWKVSTILNNIKRYMPRNYKELEGIKDHIGTPKELELLEAIYPNLNNISINSAVIERSDEVLAVLGELEMTSIRDWDILDLLFPANEDGNNIMGDHIGIRTKNSIIYGNDRLIATIGLEEMIVVDTGDALLISPKSMAQEVKRVVEIIRDSGRKNY